MDIWEWAALLAVGAFIGLGKAGFGGGIGMLTAPVLTWATGDAAFAVGVSLPMLICGDLYVARRFWGEWDKSIVLGMLPGGLLGVALATPLLGILSESTVVFNRVIGLIALGFGLLQLVIEIRKHGHAPVELETDEASAPDPSYVPDQDTAGEPHPHKPDRREVALGAGAGLLTAFISTVAHQGGLVSNLYLLSRGLTKERFVSTAMALYFTLNMVKLIPYARDGLVTVDVFKIAAVGIPAVLLGGMAGAKLLDHIDPKAFGKIILVFVFVTGIKLVIWP